MHLFIYYLWMHLFRKLIGNKETFGAASLNVLCKLNLNWRHPSTCSFSKLGSFYKHLLKSAWLFRIFVLTFWTHGRFRDGNTHGEVTIYQGWIKLDFFLLLLHSYFSEGRFLFFPSEMMQWHFILKFNLNKWIWHKLFHVVVPPSHK